MSSSDMLDTILEDYRHHVNMGNYPQADRLLKVLELLLPPPKLAQQRSQTKAKKGPHKNAPPK